MGRFLDIDGWSRRAQFDWFRRYESPYFNVCAEVDVEPMYRHAKAVGASFSLACWYAVYRVVNQIEPFRYRLRDERVWVHDHIRIATTAPTGPETFAFVYLPAAERFRDFVSRAREAIAHAQASAGAEMDHRDDDDAVVHGSILPWVRFTSISHARRLGTGESVPRIAMGRAVAEAGRRPMPLSAEVHHAMMDGVHVGRFFEGVQAMASEPAAWMDEAGR